MENQREPDVKLIQTGREYQISKAAIIFEPFYPK